MNKNPTDAFPAITTERLVLRDFTETDIDFVYRHFSDPEVCRYLLDEPPLTDLSQAKILLDFLQNSEGKNYNRWAIELKSSGQVIGTCGYHHWQKDYFRAEIGYDLAPDYWGQGYMSEALAAAIDNGFERMNLHRIDALVYPENLRSVHLLQKLGFQIEGTLRDYFYQDGKYYDHYILSLLKPEWPIRR